MIGEMTDEAIRAVINNAPEGAEYWTYGYDVGYRKLILDCVFGWFPDDEKWVRSIDNDIAMERVDKGFWIPNLVKELANRQLIPQTNIETPEEKEALDLIDTTPQQYESVASKEGEWVDGDELPPVGCEVMTSYTDGDCDGWCDFHGPSKIIAYHGDYVWVAHHGKFNQVHELSSIEFESVNKETPQQRDERERLEAAYDLYREFTNSNQEDATCMSMYGFKMSQVQCRWLAIVDKTNYRKESEL